MTRTRTTRALAAVLAFLLFATLLFAGMPVRAAGELVLKEGAAITYNKDASVMKADAVKALVDFEASGIPADYDLADFDVEYAFLGANAVSEVLGIDVLGPFESIESTINGMDVLNLFDDVDLTPFAEKWLNLWVDAESGTWDAATINVPIGQSVVDGVVSRITVGIQDALRDNLGVGFNHIQAGNNQVVRVRYQGGDWVVGSLTVNKANVKVNVRSASLYFDQVVGENFVTTDPEDDFMIFTFYSGVTTDLAPTIYFQPPENELLNKAMPYIDQAFANLNNGQTLTERLRQGMTVGEFMALANQVTDILQDLSQNALIKNVLMNAGIDVDMVNALVNGLQQISGIADNWRIAVGQPDRAGAYAVVAVAINRNYNPGVGVGGLLVKMRVFGVSLQWNDVNAKESTVGAQVDFGASAVYDGKVQPGQTVKTLFLGFTSSGLYLSGDAPTAAGRYLEAAFPLGGNYLAIPIVRMVTINEG